MSTSPPSVGQGTRDRGAHPHRRRARPRARRRIAFYLERSVLDEDGFETIATELIQSDEIREQVAATAVEQLYANVDVEQAIAERLPEAQKALAPVLAGIARQGAEEAANRLLERPRLQEAWVRVGDRDAAPARRAPRRRGRVRLDDRRRGRARPPADHHRARRRGRRSSAGSPSSFPSRPGKIAIVSSDQLETAQTAARILRLLANWLWLVAHRCSPRWRSGSRVAAGASSSGRSPSGSSSSGCCCSSSAASRAPTSSTR